MLRIKGWDDHYENAGSRKVPHCSWCPVPNKQDGLGYALLIQGRNGPARYAAFVAVVLVCSKHSLPRGGWITDNGKEDGRPLTAYDLHLKTKLPEKVIGEMLERSSMPDIGWIEDVSPSSGSAVVVDCRRSSNMTEGTEGTESTEQKEDCVPTPASRASEPKPYKQRVEIFFEGIDQEQRTIWAEAYPNVDLDREIRKAKAWLLSNTGRAKKDFKRFLNSWLARAMETTKASDSGSSRAEMPDHIIAGSQAEKQWLEDRGT